MNKVYFKSTWLPRLALSLVLVSLGVAAAQPGHAEVVERKIQINGDGTSTTTITTTKEVAPLSGTVVTQAAPVVVSGNWVFLDSRRKEIERIMAERLAAGALSTADSIRLRALIDAFNLDFNRAVALGYSLDTALPLATRLDAISGDLVTYARVSPFQNLVYLDPSTGVRTIRVVSSTTTTTPVVVASNPVAVSTPVVVSTPVAVSSNKVVSITTIEPRVIRDSIRVRHDRMVELISAGLASGNLTAAQAAIYRKQLDDLAALQASFDRGGTITYANYLPIAYQYDMLRSQLVSVIKSPTITVEPLIQNGRLYLATDRVVAFDDMMGRRAGLESKISYNLMMGRLSASKAAELRSRLDRIASLEGNYRNSGGRMNDEEAKKLYTEFDRVGSALDHAIHM
ncbi:MAG: hypothetical protein KIT34_08305 [Cyanobacteria bacterium TGS_CYA1]|nr:hypothetical protein [Cyanobacteria bacterium TGS_CYA1]